MRLKSMAVFTLCLLLLAVAGTSPAEGTTPSDATIPVEPEAQQTLFAPSGAVSAAIVALDIAGFRAQTGGYTCPGIQWQMSPSQVAQALGIVLEPVNEPLTIVNVFGKEHTTQTFAVPYHAYTLFAVADHAAMGMFGFIDDALVSVDFTFLTNQPGMDDHQLDTLYENVSTALVGMYGAAQTDTAQIPVRGGSGDRESVRWESSDASLDKARTVLQMSKTGIDGQTTQVDITFACLGIYASEAPEGE